MNEAKAAEENLRHFSWHDEEASISISIPEVIDPAYGMYVWPCAPVLAQYVWHKREWIQGKKVLEIGAGTSLPGVMAAKCGALVTLSDDCQQPRSLENCRQSCRANGLAACEVIGLTWGRVSPAVVTLGKVDVILASDCFYDTKDEP
ncbi:histone-arginine methyltransferase METTL23-like [Diadema antillarum]|uniref:histone-arginine methyltransferase METTL23-like n=1 Tax=Diadema antillarum TaxID=105358 RepID=UPI003A8B2D01